MFSQIIHEAQKRVTPISRVRNRPLNELGDFLGRRSASLSVTDTTPEFDFLGIVLAFRGFELES